MLFAYHQFSFMITHYFGSVVLEWTSNALGFKHHSFCMVLAVLVFRDFIQTQSLATTAICPSQRTILATNFVLLAQRARHCLFFAIELEPRSSAFPNILEASFVSSVYSCRFFFFWGFCFLWWTYFEIWIKCWVAFLSRHGSENYDYFLSINHNTTTSVPDICAVIG